MRLFSPAACAALAMLALSPASASSVLAGDGNTVLTWALRGGFDANPRDDLDRKSSPLFGYSAALVHERENADSALKLGFTARADIYDMSVIDPSRAFAAQAEHALRLGGGVTNKMSLTASTEDDDSTRRHAGILRERIELQSGRLRAFTTLEGSLNALNERNVLLGADFLPQDRRYTGVTLTPGVSWGDESLLVGVSVAASRLHDLERTDFIGFNRSQSRVQPFFFFAGTFFPGTWRDLKVEGSLSEAFLSFPYGDFADLVRPLYGIKASWTAGAFTLSGASERTIEQTTFPTAAIGLVDNRSARIVWKADDRNAFGLTLRQKRETYIGADISTRATIYAADYARRIADDMALTLTAAYRKSRTTGVQSISGFSLIAGIERRVDLH
jgi:hypothetical protein